MISVDSSIPAGNIIFERIDGDAVYVHQDLRDTQGDWFYWAMRVRGAAGRTLTFRFTRSPAVGVRGAVVSSDRGKTFFFSRPEGGCGDREFTYAFKDGEDETWFYECHPYMRADWDAFTAKHAGDPRLTSGELCRSRKGGSVPLARIKGSESQRRRMFVSARHHCEETMASWVVEGLAESFLADDALGTALRERFELYIVPFTDYDGVHAGDQGKNRAPHDHNRDYTEFLYPETRAIAELMKSRGGEWEVFLDIHCPWLRGDANEYAYTPWKETRLIPDPELEKRFSETIEKTQSGVMRYKASDDIPFGTGWNTGKNYADGLSAVRWAASNVPSLRIARTFEIPFANANGATVTPETCREFGRDIARALIETLS